MLLLCCYFAAPEDSSTSSSSSQSVLQTAKSAAPPPARKLMPPPTNFGPKCPRIDAGANAAGADQVKFMTHMAANKPVEASRRISRAEVAEHCTESDCWTIINGKVYNLEPYLRFHPGGKKILVGQAAGRDCTSDFNAHHPWVNFELLLKDLYLGPVGD
eukprot:Lankesteria_metandrocarpae@DN4908_c0_g1_i1.p2